jgi:hypothetical protein
MSQSVLFSVINPEGRLVQTVEPESPGSSRASLAPRLDTLDGKVVYLVDTGFGGSYRFMQQVQKWMSEHMPAVTTIRKRKPGGPFADDNAELWDEIRAKGADAVILGVGG